MNLIYYRGLNCHLASIINIADALSINYLPAYSSLWSESNFTDESKYSIYVSKRIFVGLKEAGVAAESFSINKTNALDGFSKTSCGEFFLIGTDSFYIPWHVAFNRFHEHHYFFARKISADCLLCFDPIFSKSDIILNANSLLPTAFDFSHVYKQKSNPPKHGLKLEAQAVLDTLPKLQKHLLANVLKCKKTKKEGIPIFLKLITALINNRRLFRHYLQSCLSDSLPLKNISNLTLPGFDDAFFARWDAVKNGLLKAKILKDNSRTLDEVYGLISKLIQDELITAKELIRI